MLIRDAELIEFSGLFDASTRRGNVRIDHGVIDEVGDCEPRAGETILEAGGNLLIPGLVDHHIHFLSYAASLGSIACGPPAVSNSDELLRALNGAPGDGWLRGYGYHESVAGEIDRAWLDEHGPQRPIRLQHRTGRLWIINSLGLAQIRSAAPQSMTPRARRIINPSDGRIYDADALLRGLIPGDLSNVAAASRRLAAFGITAINDMTPSNDPDAFALFAARIEDGGLLQRVQMSGTAELSHVQSRPRLCIGSTKVHLHETALPDFDALRDTISTSHAAGRTVAIHCVTEAELVFALAAFDAASVVKGDRIEHASVTPPALVGQLAQLKLTVVTQPGFVLDRGDAYLTDIPGEEHNNLYRVSSLLANSIPVAFSSDAPFGDPNPWRTMQAATQRLTHRGKTLGMVEAVTPGFALRAFLGSLENPTEPRHVTRGASADLCLLDRPWHKAKENLEKVAVRMTLIEGEQPGL